MAEIADGGPAFAALGVGPAGDVYHQPGMSLRDWFATHCPPDWLERFWPQSHEELRDAMISRGIIPASAKRRSPQNSYTEIDVRRLWVAFRYEYADAMLAARKSGEGK